MKQHLCVFLTDTHVIVSYRPNPNSCWPRRYVATPLPVGGARVASGMRNLSAWPRRVRELP